MAVVVGGEAAGGCMLVAENGFSVSICWYLGTESIFSKKLESPDMLC